MIFSNTMRRNSIWMLFLLSIFLGKMAVSAENSGSTPSSIPPQQPSDQRSPLPPLAPPTFPNDCLFSSKMSQYLGSPLEQARCLLRKVFRKGIVSTQVEPLPAFLEDNIGKPVALTKAKVKAYLTVKSIPMVKVGGNIFNGFSTNAAGKTAIYFVIHDTSDEIEGNTFPPEIDDPKWPPNRLNARDMHKAHLFISRAGDSASSNPYSARVWATKMEKKTGMNGLFLHHELVQPRIIGNYLYPAVAPEPGFTIAQLKRLALAYVVASVRKGTWMIPAFHCVIDTEIPGGHDDPQNFDLPLWAGLIEETVKEISAI